MNLQKVFLSSQAIEAFKEAGKEALRIVAIAVIPVVLASLEKGEVNVKAVLIAGAIALLRATDRWVHENPKIKANGILPW